jgi:hypothetical protein
LNGLSLRTGIPVEQLLATPLVQAALLRGDTVGILSAAEAAFNGAGVDILTGFNSTEFVGLVGTGRTDADIIAGLRGLKASQIRFLVRFAASPVGRSADGLLRSSFQIRGAGFVRYRNVSLIQLQVYKQTGLEFDSFD